MSLDGYSMRPLVRELDARLTGGRIDKITQPNKQSIVLSVRQPGETVLLHISVNSRNPSAHILERNLENPPEPPVFCMVLRKQLETGRIAGIRQHGLDRLLLMDVDSLGPHSQIVTKTLVIELMGKYSNIILVQDGKIIDALRKIGNNSSRVRTVLPGDAYELPPDQDKLDLLAVPLDAIMARLRELQQTDAEQRLDKALLAVCMGFGPISAKEVCFNAGLAPSTRLNRLEDIDLQAVRDALQEVKAAVTSNEPQPMMLLDEHKKILAMASFPLHYLPEALPLTFPTISAMLEKADQLNGSYVLPDKERFQKLVKNELNKAQVKLGKLDQEISEAENAEDYRICGDNLQTYQYQFKDREDPEITVPNIYSATGETITISLDQRYTLIENMQREDLNSIEEARGMEEMMTAFGLNQEETAKAVGKSRSYVANALRLLRLPDEIQDFVMNGQLSAGHARAIAGLEGETLQLQAAAKCVENGWSVREVEGYTGEVKKPAKRRKSRVSGKNKDRELAAVEQQMTESLGTKVRINGTEKKGKLELEYYSRGELERLVEILSGV